MSWGRFEPLHAALIYVGAEIVWDAVAAVGTVAATGAAAIATMVALRQAGEFARAEQRRSAATLHAVAGNFEAIKDQIAVMTARPAHVFGTSSDATLDNFILGQYVDALRNDLMNNLPTVRAAQLFLDGRALAIEAKASAYASWLGDRRHVLRDGVAKELRDVIEALRREG